MADLPVPVLQAAPQGDIRPVVVEGGEGGDGAAPDGGSVVECGDDRVETVGMPDRPERGDRGFPYERVGVGPCRGGQRIDGVGASSPAELAERPGCCLGHQRNVVVEGADERGVDAARPPTSPGGDPADQLTAPSAHCGVVVTHGPGRGAGVEAPQAGERPEAGDAHPRIVVAGGGGSCLDVSAVAGQDGAGDGSGAGRAAAVWVIHGRLVSAPTRHLR